MESIVCRGKTKKECICFMVLLIGLAVYFGHGLFNFDGLYVLHDEFGVWAIAAKLAGIDWSEAMYDCPYYSYGYSLFLAPLFRISKDMTAVYHLALIENLTLLLGGFSLSYSCVKRLFPDESRIQLMCICGLVLMYPSNYMQVHIAWAETLLFFLFWLAFYLFIQFINKPSLISESALILVVIYGYTVHQRTIGIVMATLLCLFAYILDQKLEKKYIVAPVIIGVGGLIVHKKIKTYVKAVMWGSKYASKASTGNDYGSVIPMILKKLSSVTGIMDLARSACGKLYYAFFASGWLLLILFVGCMVHIIRKIKKKQNLSKVNYAIGYAVISLGFMIGVCVLFMGQKDSRMDIIYYGRYFENAIGPALFFACYAILKLLSKRILLISFSVALLFNGAVLWGMQRTGMIVFQNVSALMLYYDVTMEDNSLYAYKILGMTIVVFAIYLIGASAKKKYILLLPVLLIWTVTARIILPNIKAGNADILAYKDAAQYIQEYDTDKRIYELRQDSADEYSMDRLQFFLRDKQIYAIPINQMNQKKEGVFIADSSLDLFDYLDKYDVLYANSKVIIMERIQSNEESKRNGIVGYQYSEGKKLYLGIAPQYTQVGIVGQDAVMSDGKAGYLYMGNALELDRGKYNVTITLAVEEVQNPNSIAVLDAFDGREVYDLGTIQQEQSNSADIMYSTQLNVENAMMTELRLYVNADDKIKLKSITVERTEE